LRSRAAWPWTNEAARRAGTVHIAGSFEEIAVAEREINRGRMPERPYVLVAQQYLADPTRSAGDVHPVWSYAHVPNGYTGDATEAVIDQLERFAPGIRERIVARFVRSATEMPAYNANYVGGDIVCGANTPVQVLFRPRIALDPYTTGIPGRLHLLGRDAARRRRAWDERLQRGAIGAEAFAEGRLSWRPRRGSGYPRSVAEQCSTRPRRSSPSAGSRAGA